MIIRNMEKADYYQVYELWNSSDEVVVNEDDSYERISSFLDYNSKFCFVAEENEIVGAILAGYDGRRGHIYHTIVRKDYRRRGIASSIVEQVINAFSMHGVNEVDLLSLSSNENGNAFWESRQFKICEHLNYWRKG